MEDYGLAAAHHPTVVGERGTLHRVEVEGDGADGDHRLNDHGGQGAYHITA